MAYATLADLTAAGWINERGCAATTSATGDYTMRKMVYDHYTTVGALTTASTSPLRTTGSWVTEYATTQAQLIAQISLYEHEQTAKAPGNTIV